MTFRRTPATTLEGLEPRRLLTAAVSTTEVLANFGGNKGLAAVTSYLKANPKATLAGYVDLKKSKDLFTSKTVSLVQLALTKGVTAAAAVKLIKSVPGAKWASPNYLYGKQNGDAAPNDPNYPQQGDALKQIELEKAWDVVTGSSGLTVAVIDDGFDFAHEDLQGVNWTNTGEIAGNGKDDDNNGYVDDVRGWDFGRNDNDPSPAVDTVNAYTETHGTQVASAIGATMNNGKGVAGVAAGVKIMPVRFRGVDVVVSSAGIASSVAYAVNNGAKIINLSYSFDPYMNDPAFAAAVDLAYDKNVLWINSAGNNNTKNPPRTLIDKILFVDNVDNTDVRNPTSNYGPATDLSAPGTEVMLAASGNLYYPVDGTSYAAAVTTGIAALIWSKTPSLTRDQVAARLLGTTEDIDAKNPGFAGQLGVGRVNAYKAVTSTINAPTFRGLTGVADGATLAVAPTTLTLGTLSVLNASTINAAAFELRGAGADGSFNTADDTVVPLTITSTYAYGSNKIDLAVGTTLSAGKYRFTAKTTIADPFGTTLAGAYVSGFSVAAAAAAAPTNFKAAATTTSPSEANLTWTDNSTDETAFAIERSLSSTFATIDKSFTSVAGSVWYTDWGLTLGQTYYYRISAVNPQGQSTYATTSFVASLPPAGVPAAPTGFTGTAVAGSTDVLLKWTDNSNNETAFRIQRSTSSTFATINRDFTAVAGSVWYQDWGLTANTKYYYRMAAINGTQQSAWTATISFGGPVTPTVPTAPTAFSGSGTASALVLKWTDTSNNETKFEIQRSLLSSFLLLTTTLTTPADTTTYTDKGLTRGLTYYYRIRAVNSVGNSSWSSVIAVKPA